MTDHSSWPIKRDSLTVPMKVELLLLRDFMRVLKFDAGEPPKITFARHDIFLQRKPK